MRLIDADELFESLIFPTEQFKATFKELLDDAPTVENKGEWIEVVEEKFPNGEKRMWHYECSACGTGEPFYPINKDHWDFCPNCGADMRKNNC